MSDYHIEVESIQIKYILPNDCNTAIKTQLLLFYLCFYVFIYVFMFFFEAWFLCSFQIIYNFCIEYTVYGVCVWEGMMCMKWCLYVRIQTWICQGTHYLASMEIRGQLLLLASKIFSYLYFPCSCRHMRTTDSSCSARIKQVLRNGIQVLMVVK